MSKVLVLSLWNNFQVLFTLESFKGFSLFGQDEYKTTIFILEKTKIKKEWKNSFSILLE